MTGNASDGPGEHEVVHNKDSLRDLDSQRRNTVKPDALKPKGEVRSDEFDDDGEDDE